MEKWCLHASMFILDLIFVKLAGNQIRHKISDVRILAWSEQSIWSYLHLTVEKGHIWHCPGHSSFIFIVSLSWNLQITWAGIKSHMRSKFDYLDYLLWSDLPWLLKRLYLAFCACWTQVSERCPLGDLFQLSCVKLRSHEQICLICNKDDLAVKTLPKMTIYTDKCDCSGNMWCVSVFLCTR